MQPLEKFCKKVGLNNFAIVTEKHLCWRLFLIQNLAKFFRAPILKNICQRLLPKLFMKLRQLKVVDKKFQFYIKKQDFSTSVSETSENVNLFVIIS